MNVLIFGGHKAELRKEGLMHTLKSSLCISSNAYLLTMCQRDVKNLSLGNMNEIFFYLKINFT